MKAIVTKYHGPTDTKPSHFSATAEGCKRMVFSYNYNMDAAANHHYAAIRFQREMEWSGTLVSGSLPDGRYAHIMKD